MYLSYLTSIAHYIPEIIACITMVGLLFIEATYREGETKKVFLFAAAYLGIFVVFVTCFSMLHVAPTPIFTNSMIIDPFASTMKIIMSLGTIGALYLCWCSKDIESDLKSEFAILAIGVLIGGMILVSANNMLMLYIGIETLSILSYVMASLKKTDEKSSEAGLKYSIYGGVCAAMMLFGLSHIFGILGTIQFSELGPKLQALSGPQLAAIIPSFLLFFVGLGYKIACVPFHMWSPDVYEGSPVPVTTFFSIVPKIAGIASLARITMIFFGHPGALQESWILLIHIVAALTMTVGNVSAINQSSVKRMLAYSSIAHAGNMLLGVVVINEIGLKAIVLYGAIYLFMTLVAFYITSFIQDKYGNDHFERFNGLIYRYPLMAIIMGIAMFSLVGLPPFGGFIAKLNIIMAVVNKGYYTLAFIAALNSVISLYYYMRLVRLMMLKPQESFEEISGFCTKNQIIISALCFPIVFFGLYWSKLAALAEGAKILIK